MVRAVASRWRSWRLRGLRGRAFYLEEKLKLYREFPHSLGFEALEKIAAEERRLRRILFAIGLIELRERIARGGTLGPIARVV